MDGAGYVYKHKKRLRCGYTTGACAAMAAKAAAMALLGQGQPARVSIVTPRGVTIEAEILDITINEIFARCAVKKDAGDDPDVTDGMLVYATVEKTQTPGVIIDGGAGVGRVTKPGLDQPVGAAAINRVPRDMIRREAEAVCQAAGYTGGLRVTISVPGGEEVAKKTFNPRLGVEGGISILGTSGIVEPMSEQALADSVRLLLSRLRADGGRQAVLVPGNYGEDYVKAHFPQLAPIVVKCSNFVGETLDNAAGLGYARLLLVGHLGKLVKLAGGVMNLHSAYADARLELMAAHAAAAGAPRDTVAALLQCVTAEEGAALLVRENLLAPTMARLMERIQFHVQQRAGEGVWTEAIVFGSVAGLLGETPGARALVAAMTEEL